MIFHIPNSTDHIDRSKEKKNTERKTFSVLSEIFRFLSPIRESSDKEK